ncbi:hypothetical protein MHBO_001135 [Bonamia ostreae]|uniref:Uncharacterized protein n=1 Tax=Bonamia ostreae TaxID=126728 RepID=A0ABV2AHX4_9EUKA
MDKLKEKMKVPKYIVEHKSMKKIFDLTTIDPISNYVVLIYYALAIMASLVVIYILSNLFFFIIKHFCVCQYQQLQRKQTDDKQQFFNEQVLNDTIDDIY